MNMRLSDEMFSERVCGWSPPSGPVLFASFSKIRRGPLMQILYIVRVNW